MQSVRLILVMLVVIAGACSTDHTTSTGNEKSSASASDSIHATPAKSGTAGFKYAFTKFFEALHKADTAALNQFIHPKYGVWVIEQPGALPKMTQVHEIQKFGREYQNRSFFTIAQEVQQCSLTEEAFPTFDCADMDYEAGKTGYSKDGCFVWNAEKFRKSSYWNYASLPEDQIQRIKNTLPLVQRSVLHTETSFEFHFGSLDGKWYLLFSKIIYPCSA